jgi:hypothetical protein
MLCRMKYVRTIVNYNPEGYWRRLPQPVWRYSPTENKGHGNPEVTIPDPSRDLNRLPPEIKLETSPPKPLDVPFVSKLPSPEWNSQHCHSERMKWLENLNGRDYFVHPVVGGRIGVMLIWIIEKWGMDMWARFFGSNTGTSGRLL